MYKTLSKLWLTLISLYLRTWIGCVMRWSSTAQGTRVFQNPWRVTCISGWISSLVASHQLVHIKGWRCYSFFSCFQNNSYCIIKKGWNVDLINVSSVLQFIWQQLTTILLVYHLSILRYFQFNEVSQGWRCLRIRMPMDQVPCKTMGICNLHCALHTPMLTRAKSVLTFEIGIIPW